MLLDLALYQPEIPPNTGNIIRLCANTGCRLHLIRPFGFELDDARLKRAGLDYHEFVGVAQYDSLEEMLGKLNPGRVLAFSTKGTASHASVTYRPDDLLLFGPESRGLPQAILDGLPPQQCLRVPMRAGQRSLNLANAVAAVVYEAWRQQGFSGAG